MAKITNCTNSKQIYQTPRKCQKQQEIKEQIKSVKNKTKYKHKKNTSTKNKLSKAKNQDKYQHTKKLQEDKSTG